MNVTTNVAEATWGSAEKWLKVWQGKEPDEGAYNCPLCREFEITAPRCRGCPVARVTGEYNCLDTPYETWMNLADELAVPGYPFRIYATLRQLKDAAEAEYRFLVELALSLKIKE